MMRLKLYLKLLIIFSISVVLGSAFDARRCECSRYHNRTRAFVLTDISNEPDDQMSLVRILTYSNEIDIRGIAAVTSTFLTNRTDEPTIHRLVAAYGNVVHNLNANMPSGISYPSAAELQSKVHHGHPVYGLEALSLNLSDAATALLKAADESTAENPLWVSIWGGAAVLAEVLNHVKNTRNTNHTAALVDKLRVYSISDQDDAGPWLRTNFPKLFYVVSLHKFVDFLLATWEGISGDVRYPLDPGGPNTSLVTNAWLDTHIRIGALGAYYPQIEYIMEGDTPSWFPLIRNGLGDFEHPDWGSWGGRYGLMDVSGNTNVYTNTPDFAVGTSNNTYLSIFASIWRWRQAYQYDFAARMQWTVDGNYSSNNHQSIAIVNGTCGPSALQVNYTLGESVIFDASESWDPDGEEIRFDWFHYRDVITTQTPISDPVSKNITIENLNPTGSLVKLTPLAQIPIHIILSVYDTRAMPLTTYRRIILNPSGGSSAQV